MSKPSQGNTSGNTFFLSWEQSTYCVNSFYLLHLYDNIKRNFQHLWKAVALEWDSEIVFALNERKLIFILLWGVYIEDMKILGSMQEVLWSCKEPVFGCFKCTITLNNHYWLQ